MTAEEPSSALLLAGSPPGGHAGNSVSTQVLLEALARRWPVETISHTAGPIPHVRRTQREGGVHWTLATQPLTPHAEGFPAALVSRHRFRNVPAAWVVNSRYAALPMAARIPYVLWEATTLSDEIAATSGTAARRAGLGTGLGAALHSTLLPLNRQIERASYRRAAVLLAMSEHTRACMIMEHDVPPDRVTCLPHPPTSAYLTALAAARARAQERPSGMRLLFVGRADDPRKNFGLLEEAYVLARARAAELSLTVVGPHTPVWRSRLSLDAARDNVSFLGSVPLDELVRAYLSHDLLVVSSRQEGFGIVVAEALHAGLPVLSTRCGGPEHTIASSRAGVLVEHDARTFADALVRLTHDVGCRQEMGARGRAFAERELSFEVFAHRVGEITDTVIGGNPRR